MGYGTIDALQEAQADLERVRQELRLARDALAAATARAEHAERKWHGWHVQMGVYGVTCPLCQAEAEAGRT